MTAMTMITAHAGYEDRAINIIDYIRSVMTEGIDCMEVDLRLQGDRVVLSHDQLVDGEEYVTLERYLQEIKDKRILTNCDLKNEEPFKKTLELFRAYGMEHRLIFTGGYPLEHLDCDGEFKVFINAERLVSNPTPIPPGPELYKTVLDWYNSHRSPILAGLNVYHLALTDEAVNVLHSQGIAISLWTIDNLNDLRRAFNWGVYNITTNRPAAAAAMRASMKQNA
jgi:glycerophosphoryl diester phosphodiesterase